MIELNNLQCCILIDCINKRIQDEQDTQDYSDIINILQAEIEYNDYNLEQDDTISKNAIKDNSPIKIMVENALNKCDLKKTIKAIGGLIEQREDFIHSTNTNTDNEDFLHTYNIVKQNGEKWVIMAEYDDGTSNERQFLIYDIKDNTLRDVTPEEDDYFRRKDDENPFREKNGCVFIIGRMPNNSISYGDGSK